MNPIFDGDLVIVGDEAYTRDEWEAIAARKAKRAEYRAKPEVKAKRAEYRAKPEVKAKQAEYRANERALIRAARAAGLKPL